MNDKAPYRIRHTQLCMADGMPFQQHHEARIAARNLEDVITDQLFMDVKANLREGDRVEIMGYHDTSFRLPTQFACVRIVHLSDKAVKVWMQEPVKDIKIDLGDAVVKTEEKRLDVVRGYQCFNVIDIKTEAVIESFKTKDEANTWAANQDPNFEAAA
jgi:hypothetical protein